MREPFGLTRLLSTRASVIGTPLEAITRPRSLASAQSELDLRPVFTTLSACAQDPDPSCPYAFSCTGPTSAYPRHYPGPSLLRASYSVKACGLVACSRDPSLRSGQALREPRRVSPFHVSIFRDLRTMLYAVSLVSSGYHVPHYYVAEWRHFPFGPAYQPVWQVLTHDAYASSSKILSLVTCLGRHRSRLAVYSLSALALRRLRTSRTPGEGAVTPAPGG